MPDDIVSVRYMVDDVPSAVDFYTKHFGFTIGTNFPAFADVFRGNLRLLGASQTHPRNGLSAYQPYECLIETQSRLLLVRLVRRLRRNCR